LIPETCLGVSKNEIAQKPAPTVADCARCQLVNPLENILIEKILDL